MNRSANCDYEAIQETWIDNQQYRIGFTGFVISCLWYTLGVPGNLLACCIWLRPSIRTKSSAIYLATLAINDTIVLHLQLIYLLSYVFKLDTIDYPVVCESFLFFYMTSLYQKNLLVLGFTVERFIAIRFPLQKLRICTEARSVKAIVTMVVCALLLACPQLRMWSFSINGSDDCDVVDEVLWNVWSWITEILFSLAIPLLTLALNVCVIHELRRGAAEKSTTLNSHVQHSSSPTNVATNAMLLSVSFYFILMKLSASLAYLMQSFFVPGRLSGPCGIDATPDATMRTFVRYRSLHFIVYSVSFSLYSSNFFIYVLTGQQFRRVLRTMFTRCLTSGAATDHELRQLQPT